MGRIILNSGQMYCDGNFIGTPGRFIQVRDEWNP